MRSTLAVIALASVLLCAGCGELGPNADELQMQHVPRSMYGPAQQTMNSPSDSAAPRREPVPGEEIDR